MRKPDQCSYLMTPFAEFIDEHKDMPNVIRFPIQGNSAPYEFYMQTYADPVKLIELYREYCRAHESSPYIPQYLEYLREKGIKFNIIDGPTVNIFGDDDEEPEEEWTEADQTLEVIKYIDPEYFGKFLDCLKPELPNAPTNLNEYNALVEKYDRKELGQEFIDALNRALDKWEADQ